MIREPNKAAKINGSYTVTHACGHQEDREVSYKSRFSAKGLSIRYSTTTSFCKVCKMKVLVNRYIEENPRNIKPRSIPEFHHLMLKKKVTEWVTKKGGHPSHVLPFANAAESIISSVNRMNS